MPEENFNVVYLSYDGLTDPLGQSQVLPYIMGLAKEGYSYTVISCEKENNYKANKTEVNTEIANSDKVKWLPLKYHKSPKILSTIYDLYNLYQATKEIVKKEKPQIIHCRSYISAFVGLMIKRKYKVKFIFDMRGFWADERVEGGIWNINNILFKFIYSYFKKKEKQFLEEADYIICLTEKAKEILIEWNDHYGNKIKVIPCCVDIAHFNKKRIAMSDTEILKKELNIPSDNFVISYLGSLGTWYLTDDMLIFFKQFILSPEERSKKSIFLFITPDSKEYVYDKVEKNGIPKENIRIVKAPKSSVPLYLSLSDYSIFFIKPSFSKQASSPTKQGEIMAMGIPIICNAGIGDTDEIIKKTESGILIEQLNVEYYKKIIDNIHSGSYSWQPEKIRDSAINYFSLQNGVALYKEVYQKLTQ